MKNKQKIICRTFIEVWEIKERAAPLLQAVARM